MTKENLDKQITENVPEFFFIWDLDVHEIIYLTSGFQELATVKLKEKTSHDRLLEFVHQDHRHMLENLLESLSAENSHHDFDMKVNAEKYDAQWLSLKTFPIENQNGEIHRIVGHITDITSRKAKIDSLEKLNKKTKDIIHILAHDLKNPLANITMLASMAKEGLLKNDQTQMYTFLSMIERIGNETDELIKSMLNLMELNADEIQLELQELDLSQLLQEAVERFLPQLDKYQIQLDTRFPEEPVKAKIDLYKFNHITNNLLSNAIKFTPSGSKITIRAENQGNQAMFSVTDTGIGIPKDKQDEIFREFSPARRKGLRGEKSTGLGLSIVHKIIALHKGKIEVWSEEGQSTSFTVLLPK